MKAIRFSKGEELKADAEDQNSSEVFFYLNDNAFFCTIHDWKIMSAHPNPSSTLVLRAMVFLSNFALGTKGSASFDMGERSLISVRTKDEKMWFAIGDGATKKHQKTLLTSQELVWVAQTAVTRMTQEDWGESYGTQVFRP